MPARAVAVLESEDPPPPESQGMSGVEAEQSIQVRPGSDGISRALPGAGSGKKGRNEV